MGSSKTKTQRKGRSKGRPSAPTKTCTKCKREKVFSQDKEKSDFHAKTKSEKGFVLTWQSHCKACVRRAARIRVGKARTGKAYKKRRRMTDEERRVRDRELYAERMKDPEYARARREYNRMKATDARRAAGIEPRNLSRATKLKDEKAYNKLERDFVPSQPFRDWLKRINMIPAQIANAAQVDLKRILIYYGPEAPDSVSIGFVDRVMHAVGTDENLNDLYPLDA